MVPPPPTRNGARPPEAVVQSVVTSWLVVRPSELVPIDWPAPLTVMIAPLTASEPVAPCAPAAPFGPCGPCGPVALAAPAGDAMNKGVAAPTHTAATLPKARILLAPNTLTSCFEPPQGNAAERTLTYEEPRRSPPPRIWAFSRPSFVPHTEPHAPQNLPARRPRFPADARASDG